MTRTRYARRRTVEDEGRIHLCLLIGPTDFDGYTDQEATSQAGCLAAADRRLGEYRPAECLCPGLRRTFRSALAR